MNLNKNQVRIIERLRAAALEHGEVSDLLSVLYTTIWVDGSEIRLTTEGSFPEEDVDYVSAALIAFSFVAHDKGLDE
jgi:hypothetical protein